LAVLDPLLIIGLAMLAAYRYVPESPSRHPGRVDWLAAAALSSWLVALLLPLSKADSLGLGLRPHDRALRSRRRPVRRLVTIELRSRKTR